MKSSKIELGRYDSTPLLFHSHRRWTTLTPFSSLYNPEYLERKDTWKARLSAIILVTILCITFTIFKTWTRVHQIEKSWFYSIVTEEPSHFISTTSTTTSKSTISIPWCNSKTFNDGDWISHSGFQKNHLITSDLFSSWNTETIFNNSDYYCPDFEYHHFCSKRGNLLETQRAAKISDWKWIPKCKLLPFDANAFIHMLITKGSLLIVGDSLSEQQFMSLACLLGKHLQMKEIASTYDPLTHEDVVSKRSLYLRPNAQLQKLLPINDQNRDLIVWMRSDLLVHPTDLELIFPRDKELSENQNSITQKWTHTLLQTKPGRRGKNVLFFGFLILSTGLNWQLPLWGHDDNEALDMTLQKYTQMVGQVAPFVVWNAAAKGIKVFIRSNIAGHDKCDLETRPWEDDKPIDKKFNWKLFHQFNQIWENKITDLAYLYPHAPIHYLDITTHSHLRPDAHSDPKNDDCSNLCLPSNVDDWNKLFWHEVEMLEDYEALKRVGMAEKEAHLAADYF